MGLRRVGPVLLAWALLAGCAAEPFEPRAWCSSEVAPVGEPEWESAISSSSALYLIDEKVGILMDAHHEYIRIPTDGDECYGCYTWTADTYEVRWRREAEPYELMTPYPDGGVSRWTCAVRFEGRNWREGGEWLDCEIDHPDGRTRSMAFSTNAYGRIDDPAKPGYFRPCKGSQDEDNW